MLFSAFYCQGSVAEPGPTPSPWSIHLNFMANHKASEFNFFGVCSPWRVCLPLGFAFHRRVTFCGRFAFLRGFLIHGRFAFYGVLPWGGVHLPWWSSPSVEGSPSMGGLPSLGVFAFHGGFTFHLRFPFYGLFALHGGSPFGFTVGGFTKINSLKHSNVIAIFTLELNVEIWKFIKD